LWISIGPSLKLPAAVPPRSNVSLSLAAL
jgi:hypothetical protein